MESKWLYCVFQGALFGDHFCNPSFALGRQLCALADSLASNNASTSLQLETDDDILLSKAKAALDRYGHQLVIANSLHKRKVEVALVDPEGDVNWIRVSGDREIEEDIVKELQHKHRRWISEHESLGASHI